MQLDPTRHPIMHIAKAPAKVVLWGEYAVLAGAPAAVIAVNRYADIQAFSSDTIQISASGFLASGIQTPRLDYTRLPVAHMVECVLAHWGHTEYPHGLTVHTDSTAFYAGIQKLGIGSSAAVCVATYSALARLLNRPTTMQEALSIHRTFQGGSGSGLDIACSWHGGVINFCNGVVKQYTLDPQLHWSVIFTGQSSSTQNAISEFRQWRDAGKTDVLTELCQQSRKLCASENGTGSGTGIIQQLQSYTTCLRELDQQANLNIFTPQHLQLSTIAAEMGMVYKPSGAGGGDIGIAFSDDGERLSAFLDTINSPNVRPLNLEIAPHGIRSTT